MSKSFKRYDADNYNKAVKHETRRNLRREAAQFENEAVVIQPYVYEADAQTQPEAR